MNAQFTQQTQEIIDRLKAINIEKPVYNKEIIEECFKEHFDLLKIPMLPIKWVKDCKKGYLYVVNISESAAWSAAYFNVNKKESIYAKIMFPFVKAKESGLWIFWITKKEIVCCLAPMLSLKENVLHNETGPAVRWEESHEKYYFLNGVQMKKEHVLTPSEKLDPKIILTEKNVDVRRELLRKIGIERFSQAVKTKTIHKMGNYELLSLDLSDIHIQRKYLKMLNPSIGIWHIEGVGQECKTVMDALNFRKPDALKKIPIDNNLGEDWYQQGDVAIWPRNAKFVKELPIQIT